MSMFDRALFIARIRWAMSRKELGFVRAVDKTTGQPVTLLTVYRLTFQGYRQMPIAELIPDDEAETRYRPAS
jgi:hypothetical protein